MLSSEITAHVDYILKSLDPIHHQGLRIALGAFRTSPVQSLYAEAGEPSLRHRRGKLSMNYFLKLKSLPDNPCHNVINNPPPSELFERTKTIPPFGTRTLPHIEEANIQPNSIDSQYERTPPPWKHSNIMFETSLSCFKKEQTSETVLRKEFQQLRERYNSHFEAVQTFSLQLSGGNFYVSKDTLSLAQICHIHSSQLSRQANYQVWNSCGKKRPVSFTTHFFLCWNRWLVVKSALSFFFRSFAHTAMVQVNISHLMT